MPATPKGCEGRKLNGLTSHPYLWLDIAAAAILLAAIILWRYRRPRDPEEVERRRRDYLSRVGRIVEGQILEITASQVSAEALQARRRRKTDIATAEDGTRSLVFYTYSISGVTYETAQDITGFEERACLKQIIAGQPASVKYDPQSPGNSMLIAETWSGLH